MLSKPQKEEVDRSPLLGERGALHTTTSLWNTGKLEPHLSFPAPSIVMFSRFTVEPFVMQKPISPQGQPPSVPYSLSPQRFVVSALPSFSDLLTSACPFSAYQWAQGSSTLKARRRASLSLLLPSLSPLADRPQVMLPAGLDTAFLAQSSLCLPTQLHFFHRQTPVFYVLSLLNCAHAPTHLCCLLLHCGCGTPPVWMLTLSSLLG